MNIFAHDVISNGLISANQLQELNSYREQNQREERGLNNISSDPAILINILSTPGGDIFSPIEEIPENFINFGEVL